MDTIYLIGQPGSGKTTITKEFQKSWSKVNLHTHPFKHIEYESPYGVTASLGWERQHFSGTDTLSNTVILRINDFYHLGYYQTIYGEGDRLANETFFEIAKKHGRLFLFYLDTLDIVAQNRRNNRAAETGKAQNESWAKGRATKHKNLALRYNAYKLNGSAAPSEIAQIMKDYISTKLGNT